MPAAAAAAAARYGDTPGGVLVHGSYGRCGLGGSGNGSGMNSGGELSPAANNGEAPAAVAPYRECGNGKDDDEEEEDEGEGE